MRCPRGGLLPALKCRRPSARRNLFTLELKNSRSPFGWCRRMIVVQVAPGPDNELEMPRPSDEFISVPEGECRVSQRRLQRHFNENCRTNRHATDCRPDCCARARGTDPT